MTSSWIHVPEDSDFSVLNLPFGVFSPTNSSPRRRCATRLGDTIVDLSVLEEAGLFADIPGVERFFFRETLNSFLEAPRPVWLAVRERLISLVSVDSNDDRLRNNENLQKSAFVPVSAATLHLPIEVGDYTDFYSSREHATNVGTMFRDPENALNPNWLCLPVGYHGRSSTVFLSGTPIRRPTGQLQKDNNDPKQGSVYGPCRLLDFELEMAAIVGGPSNPPGQPLTIQQAKDRIFGFVLMNDWSARDIQKWEYVPLGPFTSKNFGTTISPWIVMEAALEDFVALTSAKEQVDPVPLPYLQDPTYSSYDVALTVGIQGKDQSDIHTVSESNFRNMYWNPAQQLVHHSVTGCVMKAGDLLGTGTISGSEPGSCGSMLELSWKGTKEVKVGDEERKFLKDGDTVVMRGLCVKPGHGRIGFGECDGTILPAVTSDPQDAPIISMVPAAKEDRYRNFKLYGFWKSSATYRVRVQLAAKSINFTTVPIDLVNGEHKTDDFLAKNPLGQVPLLEFTDTATGKQVYLAQSVSIIEFLDNVFPSRPALIPCDPIDRAVAFEMVEVINSGTQPLQNIPMLRSLEKLSDGKINAQERAKEVNEKGLKALEVLVKRQQSVAAGPYCMGTFSPSIVDAFLVPQMYNARLYGVDVESVCPNLTEIEQLCIQHAWFKAAHPSVQPGAPAK